MRLLNYITNILKNNQMKKTKNTKELIDNFFDKYTCNSDIILCAGMDIGSSIAMHPEKYIINDKVIKYFSDTMIRLSIVSMENSKKIIDNIVSEIIEYSKK